VLKNILSKKQAKLQWLQNPSQTNGDSVDNINVKPVKYLEEKN
jgi:hypothetical protein